MPIEITKPTASAAAHIASKNVASSSSTLLSEKLLLNKSSKIIEDESIIDQAKDFFEKNWKSIAIGTATVISIAGLVYYMKTSSSSKKPSSSPSSLTSTSTTTTTTSSSAKSINKGFLLPSQKNSKNLKKSAPTTHVNSPRIIPSSSSSIDGDNDSHMSASTDSKKSGPSSYAEAVKTDLEPFSEDPATLSPERRAELAKLAKGQGNDLYRSKKYQKAIDLYTKAISLQPEAVFYANRAACYANLHKNEQVVEDCTEALKKDPKYHKALNRRAVAFEQLGKLQDALNDFTTVCIMEEFKEQGTVESTDRILKIIAKKEAEEILNSKEKQLPSDTFVTAYMDSFRQTSTQTSKITQLPAEREGDNLIKEAYLLIASRKYRDAYKMSTKAIESGDFSPTFEPLAYNLSGTFYFLKGDVEAAMTNFEKACELDPTNLNSIIKRASIYMERNQVEKTLEEFDKAVKIDPNDADLYYHRGQVRFLSNELAAAADDYKKSIILDPDFVYAHIQLGVAQYKMMQNNDAVATFKSAAKKFKNSPEVFNYHGEILLDQQAFPEALENFEKAISLHPDSPLPYINKAILYLQWKNDTATAEQLCRKATEVDPLCDIAYAQLAQLLLYTMRIEEALENYDKAIAVTRTEPELLNAIACREAARAQLHVCNNYPDLVHNLNRMNQ